MSLENTTFAQPSTDENIIFAHPPVETIDGISVVWTRNAIFNLPADAAAYGVEPTILKSATEKVAVACAQRIGKTTVHILYEAVFNPAYQVWTILTILQGLLPQFYDQHSE